LARKTISEKKVSASSDAVLSVIIPLKTVQEVVRIFSAQKKGPVEIIFDANQVLFKNDTIELISRIIEGKFPDYEMVIPRTFDTDISIDKNDFINAVKLTSSLANRLNEVRIVVDESLKNLKISSSSQELGESESVLTAKIKGQSAGISFNWKFMLDGIKQIKTQQVFIGLNGEQKPSCIKSSEDDSYVYVLTSIKSG
jgi:DNA polymerase-3 subunit beta